MSTMADYKEKNGILRLYISTKSYLKGCFELEEEPARSSDIKNVQYAIVNAGLLEIAVPIKLKWTAEEVLNNCHEMRVLAKAAGHNELLYAINNALSDPGKPTAGRTNSARSEKLESKMNLIEANMKQEVLLLAEKRKLERDNALHKRRAEVIQMLQKINITDRNCRYKYMN